jgi:hypothetical protein
MLGAWVRESRCALHLYEAASGIAGRVLVSPDLGYLLGRCSRVALREGEHVMVLPAESVIHWRSLQVVTSSPYLSGIARLSALFPGLLLDGSGFTLPLLTHSVDAVLAECLTQRVSVSESRIVYLPLPPVPLDKTQS